MVNDFIERRQGEVYFRRMGVAPPAPARRFAAGSEVWRQVLEAGIYDAFFHALVVGRHHLNGILRDDAREWVLLKLRHHPSFKEGALHLLHDDVGHPRTEFRGHRGSFGAGSLQIVLNVETGFLYADVDLWSPYEDVIGFLGHAGEVIGHWFKRVFRRA